MNKSLLQVFKIGFVIVCSCFFTACSPGPNTPETSEIQHAILDRRIGEIKNLSNFDVGYGTHLLKISDGSTILLTSTTLELDDEHYKTKKVEVSGILTYTKDNRQIMKVENIDILDDIEVKKELDPVVWKDYTNTLLGFSISYRDDFTLMEESTKVTLVKNREPDESEESSSILEPTSEKISPDENSASNQKDEMEYMITLEALSLEDGQTFTQYLTLDNLETENLLAHGFVKRKIGEQNLEALKKNSDSSSIMEFFVENGSIVYHLGFEADDEAAEILEHQNVFSQIVNSFRILSLASPDNEALPTVEQKNTPADNTPDQSSLEAQLPQNQPLTEENQEKKTSNENVTLNDYALFESSGYKFHLQYPKNWYFSENDVHEGQDIVQRYDFGTKPLEEQPGSVHLDIFSGSMPSGNTVNQNGKTLIKVNEGGSTKFYYQSETGRIYCLSGPSGEENILLNMAGSIQD